MFELFCLATFSLFFLYWAIEAIISIFLRPSPEQRTNKPNNNENKREVLKQPMNQTSLIEIRKEQKRRGIGKQMKQPDYNTAHKNSVVSTNPSRVSYSSKVQMQKDIDKDKDNDNQQSQMNNEKENQLDLGMIGDKDTQILQNERIYENEQENRQNYVQNFLTNFEEGKFQEGGQEQQKNSSLINKDHIQSHEKQCQQRKQERSQLQIIQALSTNKNIQKFGNIQDIQQQIVEEPLKANNQHTYTYIDTQKNDQQSKQIIQQIDQLFLNNQQQFFSVINKYKIQEARYNINSEDFEANRKKVEELQEILRGKDHEISILQIGLDEYKIVSEQTAKLNQSYLRRVSELEEEVKQLGNENKCLKVEEERCRETLRREWQREKQQLQEKLMKSEKSNEELKKKEQFLLSLLAQQKQLKNLSIKKQQELQGKEKCKDSEENICEVLKQNENEQILKRATQDHNQKHLKELYVQEKEQQQLNRKVRGEQKQTQLQKEIKGDDFEVVKKSYEKIRIIELHNQNLKNEIQFAQTQIRMFEQSEEFNQRKIRELQDIIQANYYKLHQLRTQIIHLQPILSEYESIKSKYEDIKGKYEMLLVDRQRVKNSDPKSDSPILKFSQSRISQMDQYNNHKNTNTPKPKSSINNPYNLDPHMHNQASNNYKSIKYSPSSFSLGLNNYRFLTDCSFLQHSDRQFIYETLKNLLKGCLKTEKLYNSRSNLYKNPHELIDNIRGILLVIHLQNNKILGAYTHEAFSPTQPQSSPDNIAFMFDISNKKYFTNQAGVNSISYNPNCIIWGLNEIMLKYEEKEVMYTNFCRNHNIYWDGKYRIEQFIGSDKQWARITQYELYRVSKI